MNNTIVDLETFSRIFRENLVKRSRTAKGSSDTSTSSKKRKLLKEGEELVRQVEENTSRLIESVWLERDAHRLDADGLRALFEKWYDIINFNLQPQDAYKEAFEKLSQDAKYLELKTGKPYRINKRYRVWEVSYTTFNLNPLELELAMDSFYFAFSWKIEVARAGAVYKPTLLATADYMIDGQIHPWADGCGRHSTAVVMWLSLLAPPEGLPIFETREEHYSTIRNLSGHTKYYERCLANT